MKSIQLALILNRNFSSEEVGSIFDGNLHCEIQAKIDELAKAEGTGTVYLDTLKNNTTLETAEFFTDFFSDEFIFNNVIFKLMNTNELMVIFRREFLKTYNDLTISDYSKIINPDWFVADTNYSCNGFDDICISKDDIVTPFSSVPDSFTQSNEGTIALFGFNYQDAVKSIGYCGSETTFTKVTSPKSPFENGYPVNDIKSRYAKSDVTFREFIIHQVFNDTHTHEELMEAINEVYQWDREDDMPEEHNLGVIRVEAGWIIVEKPTSDTIDEVFGSGSIYLKNKTFTEDTLKLLDIGNVRLEANGREFMLCPDVSNVGIEDDMIVIDIQFNAIENIEDEIQDLKFDLTIDDLDSKELKATVYIGCAVGHDELDFEFHQADITINRPDKLGYDLSLTQE